MDSMNTGPIPTLNRGDRVRRSIAIVACIAGVLLLLTGLFGNFDHTHVGIARLHWKNDPTPENEAKWIKERDRAIEEEATIAVSGVFVLVVGLLLLRSRHDARLPWRR